MPDETGAGNPPRTVLGCRCRRGSVRPTAGSPTTTTYQPRRPAVPALGAPATWIASLDGGATDEVGGRGLAGRGERAVVSSADAPCPPNRSVWSGVPPPRLRIPRPTSPLPYSTFPDTLGAPASPSPFARRGPGRASAADRGPRVRRSRKNGVNPGSGRPPTRSAPGCFNPGRPGGTPPPDS